VAQSLINYHRGAQVKQEADRAKVQAKQAAGIESGARFNNPALAAASLGHSSTVRLGDDQQLQAGADYSRVPFSQAVDAISGGGRRPFDMADPTMNLGDLNRTHTPAPASGGGELMPELKLPGQYIILSQLSAGGMGIIYRAKHRHTGANLAIKVLHPHIAKQAVNVIRFEQEAKAACALNHPNLVVVHDFGVTPDAVPYLVMDLIEGESLQKSVVMKGVLPYWRFLNIFEQACSALGHAHSRGVIHRDIKPSNILISTDETGQDMVRIVDFGIAKIVHKDGSPVEDLTRTGDLVGSPLYMSPEQCMGNTLDPRSDIYSLGCVMYFAITGATPFVGKNAVQTIFKHLHEMPTRPADLRPDVPEPIEQIIFRAVQKHPDQRFSGAEEMMAALQRAREMGVGNYM
jgi:serine/threonine-protein kinase